MLIYRSRRCKSEIQPLGFVISNNINSLSCTCRHQSVTGSLGLPLSIPLETLQYDMLGFGVRVQPSGAKSFIVNFRMGKGGPLKRMVIARVGETLPGQARQRARSIIERAARGENPEKARDAVLAIPTLEQVFDVYMAAGENRTPRTIETYRYEMKRYLGDWLPRPLDSIDTEDVKDRFKRITDNHGWSAANRVISLLRSLYRRPCADIEALHNPVSLWLAEGGRFHSKPRRQISTPADVLPSWRAGIEAEVENAVIRDALWFAMHNGLLREEVLTLNWEHVDMEARTFKVRHTRGTVSLELPVTTQLAGILDRRHAECGRPDPGQQAWVFPSPTSASGHLKETKHLYGRISEAGGAKFWFQGMRNCYLAVAERELLLPSSLTSRLLNRAPIGGIAAGHPKDWTLEQLREPAQRVADRIDDLMHFSS